MKPGERNAARHRRAGEGLIVLLLVLASLFAFRNVLFTGRGDPSTEASAGPDEIVRPAEAPPSLAGEFGEDARRGRYRPLAPAAHALGVALFGEKPAASGVARSLVHLLSALFVLQIGRRIFGRLVPAAAIATIFALHPLLHGRMAGMEGLSLLLSLFFGLAAWLAAGGEDERPWWTPLLLLLSIMASEVGILWAVPIVAEAILFRGKRELRPPASAMLVLAAVAAYMLLRLIALSDLFLPPPGGPEEAAREMPPSSFKQAGPVAEEEALVGPPDLSPRLLEAEALRAGDRRADAIRLLGGVVVEDPADREARLLLGETLLEHGLMKEALVQFHAAQALGGSDARALAGQARCYDRMGRREDAEGAYRQALLVEPRMQEAAMRVGVIALGRGDYGEAREFLRRVTEGRNHYPALVYLAQASEALGDFREAERSYSEAARLAPRDPSPWVHWARMLLRRGERSEAKEKLEYAARLAPEDPTVQRLIAGLE